MREAPDLQIFLLVLGKKAWKLQTYNQLTKPNQAKPSKAKPNYELKAVVFIGCLFIIAFTIYG